MMEVVCYWERDQMKCVKEVKFPNKPRKLLKEYGLVDFGPWSVELEKAVFVIAGT
jgi:hypothetical protein